MSGKVKLRRFLPLTALAVTMMSILIFALVAKADQASDVIYLPLVTSRTSHDDDEVQYVDGSCLVIMDEDSLDNDIYTVEQAAYYHGVEPDWLINDDWPTEYGNPWLRWNTYYSGDEILLPGGQVDDEGWFVLPEDIRYADYMGPFSPFYDLDGNPIEDSEDWINSFVNGKLPQYKLDKVADVMPLRNQDLVELVDRTCLAIVYDSDISMNYEPIYANLQGERYGKFIFTVMAVEVPGYTPESQSSTSLYNLWLKVEEPMEPTLGIDVTIRDHEPDAAEIDWAYYNMDQLVVWATSDYAPYATMTVSVDGYDAGSDPNVDPFILEAPMTYNAWEGRYEYMLETPEDLYGRRVTVSSDYGGAYNDYIE